LPQFAIAALIKRKGAQAQHKLRLGSAYASLDLVICREDGNPHPPDSLSWAFADLVRKSGIKRISLHCLRHTYGSLALSHGANIKTVQAALGHSSARITLDRYSHLLGGEQEEVAARMDEMLKKAQGA
jgi:integrase